MRKTVHLAAAAALALSVSGSLEAAEPFYERRLEAGLQAYARGGFPAAVRDLRIACFGFFAEPEALAACWTHLALAEADGGDREAFVATAGRILAIEERLQAYSQARLTQATRRRFEERLRLWLPGQELRTVPASAEPESAVEPAPVADSGGVEAALDEARALLASSRDRDALEAAFTDLSVTANQHPEHRELQLTVAEIGYRLRRWSDAVLYFQRGGVSESERPERLFYYAVALEETGDIDAAARVLERCLPRLQKTEYVRAVAERILGRSGG